MREGRHFQADGIVFGGQVEDFVVKTMVAPSNHQCRVMPLIARWRHQRNEQNELNEIIGP